MGRNTISDSRDEDSWVPWVIMKRVWHMNVSDNKVCAVRCSATWDSRLPERAGKPHAIRPMQMERGNRSSAVHPERRETPRRSHMMIRLE